MEVAEEGCSLVDALKAVPIYKGALTFGIQCDIRARIMKTFIKTGTIGELTFTVSDQHVIDFADESMPEVLSTPWLIKLLEQSARKAMLPVLEPHERSVGVNVNVDHIAPTPKGQSVRCQARVVTADKGLVTFSVRAWDEHELIAKGTHKRRVIDAARMAIRVKRKAEQSSR